MDNKLDVPPEILVHIFSFINSSELTNIMTVCKQWKLVMLQYKSKLWKYLELCDVNMSVMGKKFLQLHKSRYAEISRFKIDYSNDLYNNGFDNSCVSYICKHFTSLTELDLSFCLQLNRQCVSSLTSLTRLTQLRLLILDLQDSDVKILCKNLSKLKSLDLTCCVRLTDACGQHFCLLKDTLESLEIGAYRISFGDIGLKDISKLTNLKKLNLMRCDCITNTGIEYLTNLTKLEFLDCSYCCRISEITVLEPMTSLRHINFKRCELITEKSVQSLSKLTNLQSLLLSYCELITDEAIEWIQTSTSLTSLDVSKCKKITGKTLTILPTNLRSLNINDCYDCVNEILQLTRLTNLTILNATIPKISDEQVKQLFTVVTKLVDLKLSFCHLITDSGFKYIASLTQLKVLHFTRGKRVTNQGILMLSNLQDLRDLDINSCPNLTSGVLNSISKLQNLTSLNLNYCTSLEKKRVLSLKNVLSLKKLSVYGCK